ncbi:hypothetical protein K438DRAFT_1883662 [Mycena galopus ATCC 62051]|nr:hypothetical protein K438DRAFT_1883662 [Mycena galopus ATCC 62051]
MPCAPPFSGGPRLPTEIVDQVLRNLDDTADGHTLRCCGLVSHTWLVLSRTILFYSISVIRVKPHNDFRIKAFNGATIRPYVRDVHLGVDPIAEWTETHLPKLLSRFPELTTLRMTYHLEMLFQFEIQVELEHLLLATPRRGIVARIDRLRECHWSHLMAFLPCADVWLHRQNMTSMAANGSFKAIRLLFLRTVREPLNGSNG